MLFISIYIAYSSAAFFLYSLLTTFFILTCSGKPPKVNWLDHADALENFSSQHKFLSLNFHFSLPTQKPCVETRYALISVLQNFIFFNCRILYAKLHLCGSTGMSAQIWHWNKVFNSAYPNIGFMDMA